MRKITSNASKLCMKVNNLNLFFLYFLWVFFWLKLEVNLKLECPRERAPVPHLSVGPQCCLIGLQVVVSSRGPDLIRALHRELLLHLAQMGHGLVLLGPGHGHQGQAEVRRLQPLAAGMGGPLRAVGHRLGLCLSLARKKSTWNACRSPTKIWNISLSISLPSKNLSLFVATALVHVASS